MKHAAPVRRELGVRTLFNILGPLTNPAGAECQVMGVYLEDMVEILANVLHKLGCRRGFVVHGMDGMDEITLTSASTIAEVTPQGVHVRLFSPEELGFNFCPMAAVRGGDARENAVIVRSVLAGEPGPKRDIVLLNAAFSLVAAGKAATPAEGVALASEAIDSGAALQQLQKSIEAGITPRGTLIFREAHAEPTHTVFEVAQHRLATRKEA